MKSIFKKGDFKEFRRVVTADDFAVFNGLVVHPVFSTYALSRDFEWTTRQFVLEMIDPDEEGIGTSVAVEHKAPAFEGDEIIFRGYITEITGNEINCALTASVGGKIVAVGTTGQKILKKDKINRIFIR